MKIIGAMLVDLEHSPLGTRSRLCEVLKGVSILRRTVERALRARSLSSLHLVTPAPQVSRVKDMVVDLPVRVESHNAGPATYAALVRGGRIWGLDSWRGGAGGFCGFDEDFHAPLLQALAARMEADAVAAIPAAAPLFCGEMLDGMIHHARTVEEPTGLTFVQAPPGLGAMIIRRDILDRLAQGGVPPGAILAYQPANPIGDLTGRDTCYRPAIEVIHARGRLLYDTHRSIARVRRLMAAGAESLDAAGIARLLIEDDTRHIEPVPEEIEIELTTRVPESWHNMLRPMGDETGGRERASMAMLESIAASVGEHDDVRVVLGGFGEPSLHPMFPAVCRLFRDAGVMAIAVRTTGLVENEQVDAALFETPVDLVEVMLDAANGETYRRVTGRAAFDDVSAIFDRRLERRTRQNRVLPLWAPSLVKSNETFDDLEAFVDRWQRRLGVYVVTGYSHCCGQRPDRAVGRLTPPVRTTCRRVRSRIIVLADGSVTTCDQDYRGVQAVGRLPDSNLCDLWNASARMRVIREQTVADTPLCPQCTEWHRP